MNHWTSRLAGAALLGALSMPSLAAAEQFEILTTKSKITFTISTTFNEIEGKAPVFKGTIDVPGAPSDLAAGTTGAVVIDTKTMTTKHEGRDRDMHEDVIHSAKYPEIKLELRKVVAKTAAFTYDVEVNISMHGTSKSMTLPCTVVSTTSPDGKTLLSIKGKAKIKMTDYGMVPPSILVNKVSSDIAINWTLIAVQK